MDDVESQSRSAGQLTSLTLFHFGLLYTLKRAPLLVRVLWAIERMIVQNALHLPTWKGVYSNS